MYRRILRIGMALIVVSSLALLAIYVAHNFDPYRIAQDHIDANLQANRGLEARLVTYGEGARQLRQILHLEIAQKVAQDIDELQYLGQWDQILQAASNFLGSDRLLHNVDATSHQLANLAMALDKVALAPNAPQDISRQLRSQPTQIGATPELLAGIAIGLDDQNRLLVDLTDNIQKLLNLPLMDAVPQILDFVRKIPFSRVADFANNLQQGIQVWKGLPAQIRILRSVAKPDIAALQDILWWQQRAQELDYGLTHVRYFANWATAYSHDFFIVLVIGLAGAVGGWTGSKLVSVSREHEERRPKIVYVPIAQPQHEQATTVLSRNSLMCTWPTGRRSSLTLPLEGKVTLGSGTGDDVQTDSSNSVRSQVQVRRARTFYYLEVLDCTFPTLLNQQRVSSGARRLQAGDSMQIGDVSAVFLTEFSSS